MISTMCRDPLMTCFSCFAKSYVYNEHPYHVWLTWPPQRLLGENSGNFSEISCRSGRISENVIVRECEKSRENSGKILGKFPEDSTHKFLRDFSQRGCWSRAKWRPCPRSLFRLFSWKFSSWMANFSIRLWMLKNLRSWCCWAVTCHFNDKVYMWRNEKCGVLEMT